METATCRCQTPDNALNRYRQASYGGGVYNSGELTFKTAEGDKVKLSFNTEESYAQKSSFAQYENGTTVQEFSVAGRAASEYSMTVEGDLNAQEMEAIKKLADKISPMAEEFFANVDYDPKNFKLKNTADTAETIKEISVDLQQTVVAEYSRTEYSRQAPGGKGGEPVAVPDPAGAEGGQPEGFRDFPALVDAVVKAAFDSAAEQVSDSPAILRSLGDLTRMIRQKVLDLFNPTGEASQPANEAPAPEISDSMPANQTSAPSYDAVA